MSDAWMQLAQEYGANRTGYSTELYETIARFGVQRGAKILDIGCGTGIASQPFLANGFPVTGIDASESMLAEAQARNSHANYVQGSAESLPFQDEQFDVAISAQAFHWFDRRAALEEAFRVLRRGGMIAIWWKYFMSQDPVKQLRDAVLREMGAQSPANGLAGGFKEFYASRFAAQTLRVLPWRTAMPLDRFLGYERSRRNIREALGSRANEYFTRLEERLRERAGAGNPAIDLSYIQYLYLAKKP
jgi:SAM-dependent methyltransferase